MEIFDALPWVDHVFEYIQAENQVELLACQFRCDQPFGVASEDDSKVRPRQRRSRIEEFHAPSFVDPPAGFEPSHRFTRTTAYLQRTPTRCR